MSLVNITPSEGALCARALRRLKGDTIRVSEHATLEALAQRLDVPGKRGSTWPVWLVQCAFENEHGARDVTCVDVLAPSETAARAKARRIVYQECEASSVVVTYSRRVEE